jgi:hypothetical protein
MITIERHFYGNSMGYMLDAIQDVLAELPYEAAVSVTLTYQLEHDMNHKTMINIDSTGNYYHRATDSLTSHRSGFIPVPAYEVMADMAAAERQILKLRTAMDDMQAMLDAQV